MQNDQVSVSGVARYAWLAARPFVAGAMATTGAVILSNPAETVKTRLYLARELGVSSGGAQYRGFFDAFRYIVRNEGLAGLQGGLAPAILFYVAMNGTRLGSYPFFEKMYRTALGLPEHGYLGRDDGAGQMQSRLSTFGAKLGAGGTAGMLGAFVGSPFNLVKCRLQGQSSHFKARESYNYSGFGEALRDIYREGGVRGLWRGATASMMRIAVGSAVQLSVYDSIKGAILHWTGASEGVGVHLGASLLTGVIVTVCMNPLDVVSTRVYNARPGFYKGLGDCFRRTLAAEGVTGLYKGLAAHYIRLGPHTVYTFVLLEQCKILLGIQPRYVSRAAAGSSSDVVDSVAASGTGSDKSA